MKNQTFFSSEGKSKKLKCLLLQFLFGALRINFPEIQDDLSIVFTHLCIIVDTELLEARNFLNGL